MFDHFFGNFKIGNHTISHRPDSTNISRCLSKDHFGFFTNGKNMRFASDFGHRNNRRLIKDDTPSLDINQRVRCSKVNTNISRE